MTTYNYSCVCLFVSVSPTKIETQGGQGLLGVMIAAFAACSPEPGPSYEFGKYLWYEYMNECWNA